MWSVNGCKVAPPCNQPQVLRICFQDLCVLWTPCRSLQPPQQIASPLRGSPASHSKHNTRLLGCGPRFEHATPGLMLAGECSPSPARQKLTMKRSSSARRCVTIAFAEVVLDVQLSGAPQYNKIQGKLHNVCKHIHDHLSPGVPPTLTSI